MKFTTGTVRLSFLNVFEPRENLKGVKQYSATLLIPKDSKDVARIQNCFKRMLEDKEIIARLGGKTKGLDIPLRDGDEKTDKYPEFADCYYLNAKANENYPPELFNKDLTELMDRKELYAGCYAQAVLNFYPYDAGGHKGIGVSLGGLRKIKDGTPFSSSSVNASDFDDDLVKDDLDDIF